jgi:ribonuclease BN (tRNA processing enzyme)
VPLKVYGPCNRGQVEIDKTNFVGRGGQVIYTDSADPAKITATPGTRQMTETIWQAYAQCINDMALDNGYPDFRTLVEIEEIGEPLPAQTDDRNVTCPAMAPFEVYSDDLVRVSATLVSHHQVYPSFAFRFDTSDGSVVFSGDTGKNTNGNLARLADGADILVHEVIDPAWIDRKFGANPQPPMDALKTHMLESHTTIDEVGEVAEACRVKTLVLNHIVPANTPIEHLRRAKTGYSGKLIVGDDLMEIGVGQPVRANNASTE